MLDDPSRWVAVLCPRRAGKTTTGWSLVLDTILSKQAARAVVIALRREDARDLVWDQIAAFDARHRLGGVPSIANLSWTWPGDRRLIMRGARDESDCEGYRGRANDLVVVDEPGSMRPRILEYLTEKVLAPTFLDYGGLCRLLGTPGKVLAGPFYEATSSKAYEITLGEDAVRRSPARPYELRDDERYAGVEWRWSGHGWTLEDNVGAPHLWQAALADKRKRGISDDSPTWRREMLGQWVPDEGNLVYRYDQLRDLWQPGPKTDADPFGLPKDERGGNLGWRFLIGCDLGFRDPFALQVVAVSPNYPAALQCYEFVERGLTIPQMAAQISRATDLCCLVGDVDFVVGDFHALGDALLEQLRIEFGLPIEKADKKDKRDHIEQLNAALVDQKLKLLRDSRAVAQMVDLIWDPTGLKEQASLPNDAADALVYLFSKFSDTVAAAAVPMEKPPVPEPKLSESAEDDVERRHLERLEKQDRGPDDWGTVVEWKESDWR